MKDLEKIIMKINYIRKYMMNRKNGPDTNPHTSGFIMAAFE